MISSCFIRRFGNAVWNITECSQSWKGYLGCQPCGELRHVQNLSSQTQRSQRCHILHRVNAGNTSPWDVEIGWDRRWEESVKAWKMPCYRNLKKLSSKRRDLTQLRAKFARCTLETHTGTIYILRVYIISYKILIDIIGIDKLPTFGIIWDHLAHFLVSRHVRPKRCKHVKIVWTRWEVVRSLAFPVFLHIGSGVACIATWLMCEELPRHGIFQVKMMCINKYTNHHKESSRSSCQI